MKVKYKHIVIIATIAAILFFIGSLFKILHWAFPYFGGLELIVISTVFCCIAGVLLIRQTLLSKESDPLNR